MRIGINASFLRKPGTGIGQVTLYFLETLKQSSLHEHHEFFLYTESEFLGEGYPENFHFRSYLPWWKRDDLLRKWWWEKMLPSMAKNDGCEVFLSLYQSTSLFKASMGIRHVEVVHDLIPRLFPQYQQNSRQKWYFKSVEKALMASDALVAVSQSTKHDLVEFGVTDGDIAVAYPGIAPLFQVPVSGEESDRVLKKYGLHSGYLYHGGGLEIRKNTERLLLAYKKLKEKEAKGELGASLPPLVISGTLFSEKNPLATPVKKIVTECGLTSSVRLLGFVPHEDLPALYKNALFFVYPSLYEGFGLPVAEALTIGTPVLVSDNSSLPEVASDAALYIVDPLDVASIASGMERLLVDQDLRAKLKEEASKQGARFEWRSFVETVMHSLEHTAL